MAKKGGGFWDNPFGGLFDFNGDGKEDLGEQWLAFKIFEECTKEDKESSSVFSDDYYYTPHYAFPSDADVKKADTSWRKYCEDGSEFGVDPDDFDSEDDYNDALEEARYAWRASCEDGSDFDLDPDDYETEDEYNEALEEAQNNASANIASIHISVECSGDDDEEEPEEVKESNFPNKRRYNAAFALANEFVYCSGDVYDKLQHECCRFILDNADTLIAANYLDYEGGFLYAQAVKDHFKLPVSLPDEDASREFTFSQIICKIAKRDISLSFTVWKWCLEQFLPYARYDADAASDLTNAVVDDLYTFPGNYRTELARFMDRDTDFRDQILDSCKDLAEHLPELIVDAIQDGLFWTAEAIFKSALRKAGGQWKAINAFTKDMIAWCKSYDELETMEYFKTSLFPLVRAIDLGMVQDEIEEWEQDIDAYISDVEENCEKYAFSRKYAWRAAVPNGRKYDIDPRDYDSDQAYITALNKKKHGWRDGYRGHYNCGLDLDAFETQEAFKKALHAKQEEKRLQAREEQQKQREAQRQAQIANERAAMNDTRIYVYCGVAFPFSSRPYAYRTEDTTIKIGDTVIVPLGEEQTETKGTVVSVGQYLRIAAPYPVEKTKFILRKCEEDATNRQTETAHAE